jgi:hypothetical protein
MSKKYKFASYNTAKNNSHCCYFRYERKKPFRYDVYTPHTKIYSFPEHNSIVELVWEGIIVFFHLSHSLILFSIHVSYYVLYFYCRLEMNQQFTILHMTAICFGHQEISWFRYFFIFPNWMALFATKNLILCL